jgi:outer membrane protein assembly factor BamE (lipoprotein component of BamABCDE complex)
LKKVYQSIGVAALAWSLAGCMSSGVKVDQSKVTSLKPGTTTCADAVALLGQPTNSSLQSDGTRSYQYIYVQAQANAANFIPVVGTFVGGANTENTMFTMNCDKRGVLVNYNSTQGSSDVGTGLISGQKQ